MTAKEYGMTETNFAGRPDFDKFDAPQMFQTTPGWTQFVFWLFGRRINALVARVLCRAHERGLINSYQLHTLLAQFDPTQRGIVGMINGRR